MVSIQPGTEDLRVDDVIMHNDLVWKCSDDTHVVSCSIHIHLAVAPKIQV